MKKILISYNKKVSFFLRLFFDEIYVFKSDNISKINKKIKNINPDFINLREEFSSENEAAKFSDEIVKKYFKKIPKIFPEEKNYDFIYWELRKYLSFEIAKYNKSTFFFNKILHHYQLRNSKVFLDPKYIDYKVLKIIRS